MPSACSAYRLLRIARADQTPLAGFDENAFAADPTPHAQAPLAIFVDELVAVRALDAGARAIARRCVALATPGVVNNWPLSARALCCIIAGHFQHHLEHAARAIRPHGDAVRRRPYWRDAILRLMQFAPEYVTNVLNENFEDAKGAAAVAADGDQLRPSRDAGRAGHHLRRRTRARFATRSTASPSIACARCSTTAPTRTCSSTSSG